MAIEGGALLAGELIGGEVAGGALAGEALAGGALGAEAIGGAAGAELGAGAAGGAFPGVGGIGAGIGAGAAEGLGAGALAGAGGAGAIFSGGEGDTFSSFNAGGNMAPGEGGMVGPGQDVVGVPGGGGPAMLTAAAPTAGLSPETMQLLGINASDAVAGGLGFDPSAGAGSFSGGGMPGGGADYSIFTGDAPTAQMNPLGDEVISPSDVDPNKPLLPPGIKKVLNELGLSPSTAAMLGISGVNALTKPKLPGAAQTLSNISGPGAQAASAMIQSGGTGGPAWATQKASIDATIDQQIQQQIQSMVQQAVNSGQGADSQVTQQQTNKIKTELETKRQQLYAQAQQQNVQAALTQLGISDQGLAQVANAQFAGSAEAKAAAEKTAQNALMLQALSKNQGGGKAPVIDESGAYGAA